MLSIFSIAGLAAQLAMAAAIANPFNLQITEPPFYDGTYLSAIGHVGAAENLVLISAAPDPNFYFMPFANDTSIGELAYNLDISDDPPFVIGLQPVSPGLSALLTIGEINVNFTFGAGGVLEDASSSGFFLACNTTLFGYPTEFAINFFNGTGTPDYTQCINVTIIQVAA